MKVVNTEVFGPLASVQTFDDIGKVFEIISEAPLGLQCGIYTNNLQTSMNAVRRIRSGAVIVNGTSTWRVDQMPYGGVKGSGIGREGPYYAMRDLTEERLVVFNL